ncbi:MAG TPA: MFS transporter [Pseudonocardia sp.]|uniref:MFS transporter n=1 Tax=Pseudonocardia sp. TaxID=60912 RepID=UPI002F40C31B
MTRTTTPARLGNPPAAGAAPALTPAGLVTVLLAAALAPIDLFIVNVALPTIGADLHASPAALEWVVAGYGVAFALLLVIGGRLGDAFGRRRLLLVGLGAFTLTSLVCGLAPTAGVLVAARLAQGAAAALLVPQTLSLIQATTSGERRATVLGYFGATGGISMVIGQLLGGLLVSADLAGQTWRPIFLVNVPIGVLAVLLVGRYLPETRARRAPALDRWGTPLLAVSLLALLIPLMQGHELGWPVWCWLLLAASPLLATAFVLVEARVERTGGAALLPPSVLRMPTMRRGLTIAVPFFAGFGGFMFVYALMLQDGLHLGPFRSGMALTPAAVSFLVTSLLGGRLVARFGHRVVIAGALLLATSLLVLAGSTLLAWPRLGVLDLLPGMALFGIGQGLGAPTLFRVILSRVPTDTAGVGSGMLTTTQQTSLALGVATLGSLFTALASGGYEYALVIVSLVQAALSLAIAVLARKLPDPRL